MTPANWFRNGSLFAGLLCEQFDVIILQELWLSSEDVSLLRSIHKAFEAYAVSVMNDQLGIQVGRPFGGIGVLWRKSISHACTICDLQDNRLLGITLIQMMAIFLF